jgi:hypothetical protein
VLEIFGFRRIGNGSTTDNNSIGGLGKEERRVAHVIAHFLDVLGIVAAHAIDTPNRIEATAGDGDRNRRVRFEQEISHAKTPWHRDR